MPNTANALAPAPTPIGSNWDACKTKCPKATEHRVDKVPPISNLLRSLSASVAQLVEQLTLNFRTGFFRFSLVFAPVENSYSSARSHFSSFLALTRFRSQKCAEYTIRDTMDRSRNLACRLSCAPIDSDELPPASMANCIPLYPVICPRSPQ